MSKHMYTLYLIRGLPGSGKSTLGKLLAGSHSFEADDYFMKGGVYTFDPSLLPQAHESCQLHVEASVREMVPEIAVCNTFSEQWEVDPYLEMLKEYHLYTVNIIECQSDYGSVHGVPDHAVQAMKDRWCSLIVVPKELCQERLCKRVTEDASTTFKADEQEASSAIYERVNELEPDKYDGVQADTHSL